MRYDMIKLKDVIKEVIDYRGKTPKKLNSNWSLTGYRALSAKNIKTGKIVQQESIRYVDEELYKKWMKQEVEKGTIILTSEAPFGEVYYWNSDEKIVLSQRLFGLKVKEIYNSEYIYYWIMSSEFQHELKSKATGSTVIGLRQPELLECNIRIPNINEQDKIAHILSKLDRKTYVNNQMNDNLLKIALTLLNKAYTECLEFDVLGNIIKFIKGKRPNDINSTKKNNYEKYLTIACLNNQELNFADISNMVIAESNVLMVMDGASSGDVYFSNYGIVGSTLAKVDITNDNYISEFIYFILKKYNELIRSKNTGSAIPHIDKEFVNFLKIPKIKLKEQEKYKIILSKILKNQKQNEILTRLRDTLLPKLMNGEINLDKIEI